MSNLAEIDLRKWYEGTTFTSDWLSDYIPSWQKALGPIRESATSVLEMGSWEGRSAIFSLNYFPNAKLTIIDVSIRKPLLENLAPFMNRVETLQGTSTMGLETLRLADRKFDFIYIDGEHSEAQTMIDSILSWQLLKVGGVVIWDDYLWKEGGDIDQPKKAVDTFLDLYKGHIEVLHHGYQVIARKTSERKAQYEYTFML